MQFFMMARQFPSVLTDQIWSEMMFISKDAQCCETDFCVPEFSFKVVFLDPPENSLNNAYSLIFFCYRPLSHETE